MIGYIYGLKCPIRNEIVYVGQTHNDLKIRLTKHLSNTRTKIKNKKSFNKKDYWIKKLIRMGIETQIEIILIEECDISIIDDREIYWISEYKKYDFNKNLAIGGSVNRGHRWSDEARENISKIRKGKNIGEKHPFYGKKHDEETKKLISEKLKEFYSEHEANFKGKKHNEESLKKISENRTGKTAGKNHPLWGTHRSEETKKKISNANKGKNHPNYGIPCSEETKKKISEANSGEKNGMYVKHFTKTE